MDEKTPGVGVGTMILRDGKVLLGKRNKDPEKAGSELHGEGTWTMPGGKIRFGEGPEEAAFREVMEETGIRIKSPEVINVSSALSGDAHFITIGILSGDFEGEPEAREPMKSWSGNGSRWTACLIRFSSRVRIFLTPTLSQDNSFYFCSTNNLPWHASWRTGFTSWRSATP